MSLSISAPIQEYLIEPSVSFTRMGINFYVDEFCDGTRQFFYDLGLNKNIGSIAKDILMGLPVALTLLLTPAPIAFAAVTVSLKNLSKRTHTAKNLLKLTYMGAVVALALKTARAAVAIFSGQAFFISGSVCVASWALATYLMGIYSAEVIQKLEVNPRLHPQAAFA